MNVTLSKVGFVMIDPNIAIKVDAILAKQKQWGAHMQKLRDIVRSCGLDEDIKWRLPCYTVDGKNVVIIQAFKEYSALLFLKGALLMDTANILVQMTENVQAARQLRFTTVEQIEEQADLIRLYVDEAVANEKAGRGVDLKKSTDFALPTELAAAFSEEPSFEAAFRALTPGRQRAYVLHFGQAKQSATRAARIEKARANIMNGKGLND